MALAGELAKYVGNELVKTSANSALSSLLPSTVARVGTGLAAKAGGEAVNKILVSQAPSIASKVPVLTGDAGNIHLYRGIKAETPELLQQYIDDMMNPNIKPRTYEGSAYGEGYYFTPDRDGAEGYASNDLYKPYQAVLEISPTKGRFLGINKANQNRPVDFTIRAENRGVSGGKSLGVGQRDYENYLNRNGILGNKIKAGLDDIYVITDNDAMKGMKVVGTSTPDRDWQYNSSLSNILPSGSKVKFDKDLNISSIKKPSLGRGWFASNENNPHIAKALKQSGADKYLGNRMLDKNGKPMTFYHSTPNEFSKFDDARLGENTGYDNTGLGHFVTTDRDFSKRFIDIDNTGKTGRTMELQAKIQKPITHPYMAGQKYDEKELDKIVEDYFIATNNQDGLESLRELAEEDGTSLYDAYMDLTFGGDSPFEYSADERKALLDNGYDAVEIVEGPKSGLVDGSKDDSIVSSYAVLTGDNLRPIRHIPVQQDNYIPLYHQTSANSLADFSLDKRSAGMSDATMPEGIFLKETNADIGLPGKNQLQLDARLNNPLKVMNRDELKAKLIAMNPKVAKYLRAETDLDNYYSNLSEEAQDAVDKAYEKMYYDKSDANKKAFAEAAEKMKGIIPEWREKIKENAATSQKEIKKLLKENGYDGMIMDEDRGSFGRKVKSYLVLDKEQLRDNSVPVKFDKRSSNFSNSKIKDKRGNLLKLYHGTDSDFREFRDVKTEPGYWFTEDKNYALSHGKNLKTVNLNMVKPLDVTTVDGDNKMWKYAKDCFGRENISEDDILSNKFRDYLMKMGYDGMIFDHSGKNTYIAFSPEQIKILDK